MVVAGSWDAATEKSSQVGSPFRRPKRKERQDEAESQDARQAAAVVTPEGVERGVGAVPVPEPDVPQTSRATSMVGAAEVTAKRVVKETMVEVKEGMLMVVGARKLEGLWNTEAIGKMRRESKN